MLPRPPHQRRCHVASPGTKAARPHHLPRKLASRNWSYIARGDGARFIDSVQIDWGHHLFRLH
eukprot:3546547-Prorocentrum_lima.AAC.1